MDEEAGRCGVRGSPKMILAIGTDVIAQCRRSGIAADLVSVDRDRKIAAYTLVSEAK
jgi:hypothetical protein